MPHLDHTGPEGKGPKTGRKLGKCKKTQTEQKEIGELGKGQGDRRHSGVVKERGNV
jgi:hypothetical protein